jgi:serine/threonine-protein kinase
MEPNSPPVVLLDCPSRETLLGFDQGRLPVPELDAVAAHLSSCPKCERLLHDLQINSEDDELIRQIRECLSGPPAPEAPVLDALERLAVTDVQPSSASPRLGGADWGGSVGDVQSVGQFVLRDEIGRGGMGVVYRAWQPSLGRMVALKMILAGHHAGPGAVSRFVREGQAVARLDHPNVVRVHDLGEHNGLPYLAMELVEGGSLQKPLSGGPLDPRSAVGLLRAVALAVDYAHRRNVVHRDLKPSNILLARDGAPKITDFGLAKLLDGDSEGSDLSSLTETGAILGTANYMSPEQAAGQSDQIGPLSDVYSLGAILYEMLAGRPPFRADSKFETLVMVRSVEPEPPSRWRPGVPAALEGVCLRCLEKSPSRRYPSAQALADDLGRWLDGEKPRDGLSRLTRALRRARGYRKALLGGGAALLIVLALVAALSARRGSATRREAEAVRSELALGRPVRLIGETGRPRSYRWLEGGSDSRLTLAPDGATRLHTYTTALVELVADPQWPRYRLSAQIRHEQSDISGTVGLYVARAAQTLGPRLVHRLVRVRFNNVRGDTDVRRFLPNGDNLPARRLPVKLEWQFFSSDGESPGVDWRISGAAGPQLDVLGANNGVWNDLEVVVTPERITALWNGQPFGVDVVELVKRSERSLTENPQIRGLQSSFNPQGGIGLILREGSASFRSVKVTPL